jgi:hypothetical protein
MAQIDTKPRAQVQPSSSGRTPSRVRRAPTQISLIDRRTPEYMAATPNVWRPS